MSPMRPRAGLPQGSSCFRGDRRHCQGAIDRPVSIACQHFRDHEATNNGHDPIGCAIGRCDQRDGQKQWRYNHQSEKHERKCENDQRSDNPDWNAAGEYPDCNTAGHLCRADNRQREHHGRGAAVTFSLASEFQKSCV